LNQETFSHWLIKQNDITQTKNGFLWYSLGPGIFQAFPYHETLQISTKELLEFLKKNFKIALRYSTSLADSEGRISYHVVWDQPEIDLNRLSKSARYDIKMGLNYALYEPISFHRLAEEGWQLRKETLERQGRLGAESEKGWKKMCLAADGLEGFEAWGALHEGRLVAAILTFSMEDTVSILYQQSLTAHLKYGVNNALAYTFTKTALSRPGIRQVFYGLHSLDAPPSVDQFKFRMGFRAKPVRQRVVFHPWVAPLVNNVSLKLLSELRRLFPRASSLAKAEGMFLFYLEGKKPLHLQNWPEALLDQRDQILASL